MLTHELSCCIAHEGCVQLLTANTAHLQALCYSSIANNACELAAAADRAMALQGLRIVDLYAKKGIDPSRLYIKAWPLHAASRPFLAAFDSLHAPRKPRAFEMSE